MVSDFDRPPPGPDHKQMQKNDRFKLVLKQGFWTKITPVFSTHQKNHEKLTIRGVGVNPYKQPDRKKKVFY